MTASQNPVTILGIDPGFARCGYGVISTSNDRLLYTAHGIIETSSELSDEQRLLRVSKELEKVLSTYKPVIVSVEDLFFFKNAKTAMKVAQARGVILVTVAHKNIPIASYTPLQIKQAVTGYGRADKKQMQEMVRVSLNLSTIPKPDDAADGLACAICEARMNRY